MTALTIRAVGGGTWSAAEARAAAVAILKNARKRARRTNRFIDIALAGAVDCCEGQELPANCGVYLATCHGDAVDTREEVLRIQGERRLPMPVAFINLSGNIAGFHIAHALGVTGPNISLSADRNIFLRALELAALDLESGVTSAALVGHVDEDSTFASSYWLLLTLDFNGQYVLEHDQGSLEESDASAAGKLIEVVRAGGATLRVGTEGNCWQLRRRES